MNKKKQKLVIIPIEVKIREFLSRVYLAYNIVKKSNISVVIGGQRELTNSARFSDCIYLDKNTFPSTREKHNVHLENDICMIDEEGPISFHDQSVINHRYNLKKLLKQISFFLFCGKLDLKRINKKLIKSRIFITGNPRYDIIKKKNLKIFKKEINYIKKKYKKFIFFTSHANSLRFYDKIISNKLDKNNKKSQDSDTKFFDYREIRYRNYLKLTELSLKMARKYPNRLFVFRKHPSEPNEIFKSHFRNKPKNLKLIYKFTVTPWLYSCDAHINSGCTTLLESVYFKKKIITFLPFRNSSFSNYKLFKPLLFDENEILGNNFNTILNNKNINTNLKNLKKICINFDNTTYAHDLIIPILKRYFKNKASIINFVKIKKNKYRKLIDHMLSNLKTWVLSFDILRNLITTLAPLEFSLTKERKLLKYKDIKKSEILKLIKIFKKIDKNKSKLKVQKISESVFYIKKI